MPVNKYGMLFLSGMVVKRKIITAMGTCPMTIAPKARGLSVLPLTRAFQLAVMLYVRFPLSLRNVEDLLHECGVDASYKPVRYWWHRFGLEKP